MPPRLEVIADENAVEAALLGGDSEVEQGARTELFGRGFISEPEHISVSSA
jgi:hypothetical protein